MSAQASFDFGGARVLVTGGSNGIGLGIARAFAESNARVVVTGRRGSASEYDHDLSGLDYRQAEMTDQAGELWKNPAQKETPLGSFALDGQSKLPLGCMIGKLKI